MIRTICIAGLLLLGGLLSGCEEKKMDAANNGHMQAEKNWGTLNGEGGCHCGKIRYRVENGTMHRQSHCDCAACRKTTGAVQPSFITVDQKTLTITQGEPKEYKSDSGWKCDCHGSWRFCGDCGSTLFWVPFKGDQIDILAGTLDDPSVFVLKE